MNNQDHLQKNAGKLLRIAEAIVQGNIAPSLEMVKELSPEALQQMLSALQVQQAELTRQNEELHRTRMELEIAQSRSFDLYERAPVGYCTISEKGLLLEANLAAASYVGRAKEALLGQPFLDCILPEDRDLYCLHIAQLFVTGAPQTLELRLIQHGDGLFWVRLEATLSRSDKGDPECHVVISDITDSKQSEEYLRKYKNIVNSTPDGMAFLDEHYRYILVNDAYEMFSGKNREQFIGLTVAEYLGEEVFLQFVKPNFDRCLQGEVVNYQQWFTYPSLGRRFVDVTYFPYRNARGHIAGIVASTRDLTGQKQAEDALRNSEERFALAMQATSDGIFDWNLETDALYFSPGWKRMLGYRDEELHNDFSMWERLTEPEDVQRSLMVLQEMLDGQRDRFILELRMRHKDGHWVDILSRGNALFDENGTPVRVVGTHVDITEQKRNEQQVRESEGNLKALLNASTETLSLIDPDGTVLVANKAMAKRLQTSVETLIGRNVYDYLPPEVARRRQHYVQQVIETGVPFSFVDQLRNLIIESHLYPVLDAAGHVIRVGLFALDITRRAQAEQSLQESRALLNATQQLARVGGWEWDPIQQIGTWTEETYRIHGFSLEDMRNSPAEQFKRSFDCYAPGDRRVLRQAFHRCVEQGQPYDLELSFTSVDGRRLWVRTMAEPVWEQGRVVKVTGNIIDITRHKQMENLLQARVRLSEAAATLSVATLLQNVLDEAEALTGSCIGFFHYFEEEKQTLSLQAWSSKTIESCRKAGGEGLHYSVDAAGVWADCIRERRPIIHNAYAELPHRKGMPAGHVPVVRELTVPVFRGERIVAVFGVGNKEQDYEQQDIALLSTLGDLAWDIVLRKREEDALRLRESSLQSIFRAAPVGIGVVVDRYLQTVNDQLCAMTGYAREELLQQKSRIFYPTGEQYALVGQALCEQFNTHGTGTMESQWRRKDGTRIDVLLSATPIDSADLSSGITFTALDITDRKQAEEQLQAMAAFPTLNLAPVIRVDEQGIVMMANPAGIALGIRPGVRLGEALPALASIDYSTCIGSGKTLLREADLGPKWFQFAIQGEPSFRFAHIYGADITDLKRTEENLSAALSEKEVLLREVHHRVKNNLAAIIGLMDMQRRILDDPLCRSTIDELSGRIRSMSLVHEKLYQAESLAHIDFQEYIQTLVSYLRTSFDASRINCEVVAHQVEIPLDLAIPCGLIINELITNALKYAFPEGRPSPGNDECLIRVTMSHENGTYTLSVADNGIGLPPGFDWNQTRTLGMILIRMLGQHQLGGSYELAQQGGTQLTLTFTARKEKTG